MPMPEIMDVTKVCESFPEICSGSEFQDQTIICRDNLINTIDRIFIGNIQVVCIEGDEGMGKSTLLAQYALNHPNNTFSLFIKPLSRWGYAPEIIRFDLCNQIYWVLNGKQLEDPQVVDESFFANSLLRLGRLARLQNQIFHWVIDGLDDIPEEARQVREIILNMLPLGLERYRFLFSGDGTKIFSQKKINYKPFTITGFIFEETAKYFDGLNIKTDLLREIHKTCYGIPGNLATVKRILTTESNLDKDQFILNLPDTLPDLFEIEWKRVDIENKNEILILAILALDRNKHNISDLSNYLEIPEDKIAEILVKFNFIEISDKDGLISYISESFRKFAYQKLSNFKNIVNNLIIGSLLKNPHSDPSINYLPGYFEQSKRFDDLVNYLSPELFIELVERSQSLSVVQQQADLGVSTAANLKRDGDLMRFIIQKSAIQEINNSSIWRSEVEARMAINQYDVAISLAQSVLLKEDKLQLLSIVVRQMRENNHNPEPEIIEQIRQLYSDIDQSSLGMRGLEIASDLIYVLPDLAVNLVENANGLYDKSDLDWAFSRLSLAARDSKNKFPDSENDISDFSSKISDPVTRRFTKGLTLSLGKYSAEEVILEIEKFSNVSDQLYMLRQWAKTNPEREDTLKVVDYGLKLAIKTTEYLPNARILRELATPLPSGSDIEKVQELVKTFDGLRGTIEHLGPTEEYVRLQLTLAEAESLFDFISAGNRLVDSYLYIASLNDLSIKTTCMARLVSVLIKIDKNNELEEKDGIFSLAREELISEIDKLLKFTAFHFDLVKRVIKSLATSIPETAFNISLSLNTEYRRDLALGELIESYSLKLDEQTDFEFLKKCINKIVNPIVKGQSIMSVIENATMITSVTPSLCSSILWILDFVDYIQDSREKCKAYSMLLSFLGSDEEFSSISMTISTKLKEIWDSIDIVRNKVDTGFKIVSSISKSYPEIAAMYMKANEDYISELPFDSLSVNEAYLGCVSLAIRAYSGLLPKGIDNQEDFESLEHLINHIPSNGERVLMWSDLALRCKFNEHGDLCTKIVDEKINPLFENISDNDIQYKHYILSTMAPALYFGHNNLALDLLSKQPSHIKDICYNNIAFAILSKTPVLDPYEQIHGNGFKNVSFTDILDIIELLGNMQNDSFISYFINSIVQTILEKRMFNEQQKANIYTKLSKLIEDKFPNQRFIQHYGYKIASQATINRITKVPSCTWQDLISQAKDILNIADRAYVLGIIAISLPNKESEKRKQCIQDARILIDTIPAAYDRIEHYEMLAELVSEIDKSMCKDILKTAMSDSTTSDEPELYQSQRKIIDLAYRIDSDLASTFASLIDDDEARISMRRKIDHQVKLLELKNQLINGDYKPSSFAETNDYSSTAWKVLALLNSGRVTPVHTDTIREYLKIASNAPFTKSLPIMEWAIQNAIVRYAKTDYAIHYIRPMFEASRICAELIARMALRVANKHLSVKRKNNDNLSTYLVRPNERDKAIQFLSVWFENEVNEYLKICDPYFGLDDLEILKIINTVNPNCRVQILTGKNTQKGIQGSLKDTYIDYWRTKISEQEPPDTEIVIVGTKSSGKPPIHDRWWISKGTGLRVGTSFNSLGINKLSEISILTSDESRDLEDNIDQYLLRKKREHQDERLVYEMFELA